MLLNTPKLIPLTHPRCIKRSGAWLDLLPSPAQRQSTGNRSTGVDELSKSRRTAIVWWIPGDERRGPGTAADGTIAAGR